jgi:hypothetical protein
VSCCVARCSSTITRCAWLPHSCCKHALKRVPSRLLRLLVAALVLRLVPPCGFCCHRQYMREQVESAATAAGLSLVARLVPPGVLRAWVVVCRRAW